MKNLIITFGLCLLSLWSIAQEEGEEFNNQQESNFLDRAFLGGNFGLQFGNITFIDVSPIVGYRITDRFHAGPGITYRYFRISGFEGTSTYGGSLFARRIIGAQFFAQAQYEQLNTIYPSFDTPNALERGWVPGFFLGGGIFQPLGRRGAVILSGMYNLLYDNVRSPYGSPWVFNVGFTL